MKPINYSLCLVICLFFQVCSYAQPGTIAFEEKLTEGSAGFTATIDPFDYMSANEGIGDLDGDGINDIAIGAYRDDDGGSSRGAVYICFLNTDGTIRTMQKISDTQGGLTASLSNDCRFGTTITRLNDLDGDGVSDIAVQGCSGVFILFLNNDGTVKSHTYHTALGGGGAFLGDLDGDGVVDMAGGASGDSDTGPDRGAIYVKFLNTDGTIKAYQKINEIQGGFTGTLDDGDRFGNRVAEIGDLDQDGVIDLAVYARGDDDGLSGFGAVWILFLNTDGTVKAHQKISYTQGGFTGDGDVTEEFGAGMAGVGDLDGDGVIDIAVGADRNDESGFDAGCVWIFFMNTDGTIKSHQKINNENGGFTGPLSNSDNFGSAIGLIGDINGDGFPEIGVGAWIDDDAGTNAGAVYLLSLNGNSSSDGIVLWNKLGSAAEVQNSEVGEDGFFTDPLSNFAFEPAQHGNGFVRTSEAGEPLVKFPGSVLHNLSDRGSMELWINPKVPNPVPFSYGVFGLVGAPAGAYWDRGNVYLAWGDGVTGRGIYGGVYFGGGSSMHVQTPSEPTQYIATVGTPFHVAISWDIDGIAGTSDKVRVFRDGVIVGSSTASWDPNGTALQERFRLGYGPDAGGFDKFISDNIKVWDYAKTDFSDRFVEGLGSPLCLTPSDLSSSLVSATSVVLDWSPESTAQGYLLQGRKIGEPTFFKATSLTNSKTINFNFELGETYEWKVASYCEGDTSDFSPLNNFTVDTGCAPLSSIVEAWFPGEGDATEIVAGLDGNLINGVGFGSGLIGNSFELDGLNDYIEINDLAPVMAGTSDLTIEYWTKMDAANQTDPGWVSNFAVNTSSNGNVLLLLMGSSSAPAGQDGKLWVHDGFTGTNEISSSTIIGDNNWHHIAYTKNGSLGTLYIDGIAEGTHSADMVFSASNRWTIGMEYDSGPTDYMTGSMDEVSVYKQALSAAEIMSIYQAGAAGKCLDCIVAGPVIDSLLLNPASVCCDGIASVFISGGSPPYTYSWNDAASQTSAAAYDLCPGDYTVQVIDFDGCKVIGAASIPEVPIPTPTGLSLSASTPSTATLIWTADPMVEKYRVFLQEVSGGPYLGGITFASTFIFAGLSPATTYRARVRAACGTENSAFSDTLVFTTPSTRAGSIDNDIKIFPNPVDETLYIDLSANEKTAEKLTIQIVDGIGVVAEERQLRREDFMGAVVQIDISDLSSGVYFVKLISEAQESIFPLMVE